MKKTTPKQTVAAKAVEKPTDPMPPVLAKEDVQEEPKRFHGDPTHAQSLLLDPERKTEAIRYAAEHGYNKYRDDAIEADDDHIEASSRTFAQLNALEKFGILNHVAAIVNDPYAKTYAAQMPNNHDRAAYRALDNELRKALGYAEFRHE